MRLVLVITVQLVLLLSQNVLSRSPVDDFLSDNIVKGDTGPLKEINLFGRFWDDVKKHWSSFKRYAESTQKKIKAWAETIKEHAQSTKEYVADKIENMKAFLEKQFETGKNVQICLKRQQAELEEITRKIFESVVVCLSDNVMKLNRIERDTVHLNINETAFMSKLESNLEECLHSGKSQEECILRTRGIMFDDIDDGEGLILDETIEKRNQKNDIIESIVSCAVNGLVESSSAITNKTIEIIHCVRELDNADVRTVICV